MTPVRFPTLYKTFAEISVSTSTQQALFSSIDSDIAGSGGYFGGLGAGGLVAAALMVFTGLRSDGTLGSLSAIAILTELSARPTNLPNQIRGRNLTVPHPNPPPRQETTSEYAPATTGQLYRGGG